MGSGVCPKTAGKKPPLSASCPSGVGLPGSPKPRIVMSCPRPGPVIVAAVGPLARAAGAATVAAITASKSASRFISLFLLARVLGPDTPVRRGRFLGAEQLGPAGADGICERLLEHPEVLVEHRLEPRQVMPAHCVELALMHVEGLPVSGDASRVGVADRRQRLRDPAHGGLELAVVARTDERAMEERVGTHHERPLAKMAAQELDRAVELRIVVVV